MQSWVLPGATSSGSNSGGTILRAASRSTRYITVPEEASRTTTGSVTVRPWIS
jgi:hypothetical protein